jgi:HEAT repeat protein
VDLETGVGFLPFGGEAYEVVKRIRKDGHTQVRVAAAKELAGDSDPAIDAALTKACSDKKWPVRAAAIHVAKKALKGVLHALLAAPGSAHGSRRWVPCVIAAPGRSAAAT